MHAGNSVPAIAIIDDDSSIRFAVAALVRSLGFSAYEFASAGQYLQSPERRAAACIICDVQMRGVNGLEMQSRLAAEHDLTPIIFITAFPRRELEKRALEAGAVCFLTKPFDNRTLIGWIDLALKRHFESGGGDEQ